MAKILRNKPAELVSSPLDAPSGPAMAFGPWDQHRSNLIDTVRAWAAAVGDVSTDAEEGLALSVYAELVRRLWDVRSEKIRIGFILEGDSGSETLVGQARTRNEVARGCPCSY